jgi:metal-sulfur cluster biosynthetic enzyme
VAQPLQLAEADILAALRDCYDPALSLNVVELGLVHAIRIAPDPDAPGAGIPGVPRRHRVQIDLLAAQTLSEESSLPALVQNRLAAFETISRSEVKILDEPAWTIDRISSEARARIAAQLTSSKSTNVLVQIQTNPREL